MIFLANENAPIFRRYFLLIGILFSFSISFWEFALSPSSAELIIPVDISNRITEINRMGSNIISYDSSGPGLAKRIIAVLYLSVFIVLVIRYIFNVRRLRIAGKNAIKMNGYKVAVLKQNISPYSFLNTIYISESDFNNGTICKEILVHELVHIKQKHSIDILFIEFLRIIFWFNPLLLLYKKEMILNHEYLADRGVIDSDIDISDYQYFMLNSAFRNNPSYLASSFNYSFIKKRIIMLRKERSSVRLFFKNITIIPLIVVLALTFTMKLHAMSFDADQWWEPILMKHNLKAAAYNNFENTFMMGETNTIDAGICTCTNATMIIRGNEDYSIIQADCIIYNINTKSLKIVSGEFNRYSYTDSDISAPKMRMMSADTMKIYSNHTINNKLLKRE